MEKVPWDAISTDPALSCREARTENLKPHTAVKALDRHRFYTRPTPVVCCHRQHEKNGAEKSTDTALRVRALGETRVASLLISHCTPPTDEKRQFPEQRNRQPAVHVSFTGPGDDTNAAETAKTPSKPRMERKTSRGSFPAHHQANPTNPCSPTRRGSTPKAPSPVGTLPI